MRARHDKTHCCCCCCRKTGSRAWLGKSWKSRKEKRDHWTTRATREWEREKVVRWESNIKLAGWTLWRLLDNKDTQLYFDKVEIWQNFEKSWAARKKKKRQLLTCTKKRATKKQTKEKKKKRGKVVWSSLNRLEFKRRRVKWKAKVNNIKKCFLTRAAAKK